MGNTRHLALEEISALVDGELAPALQQAGKAHLFECPSCRGVFESFSSLDLALRRSPAISCEAALPLLSARLDREADVAEAAVANAHLATCATCHARLASFGALDAALRALPSGVPSARVDRAIAGLRRQPRALRIPAIAARGFIAVATALLLVVAGLSRGLPAASPLATNDGTERALVAAAQQVVFKASTNTLYVLDTPNASVDARDATTNAVVAHIEVGGRPTAMALNESANTLLVLDSSQKRVTEIDTNANKIVSATTVAVAGTPTAISVDPSSSKIVVSSGGQSGAQGSLAVIDSTTKKVETVRDFTATPQALVFSPTGDRSAVVTTETTTILDASYKTVATLPGGIAAAFAQGDDRVAVLSEDGSNTVITYSGTNAPLASHLEGKPRAITSLPDGGYLVLVDVGSRSRVNYVVPDGHVAGSIDFAGRARGLVYDSASRRFSVAIAGEETWAEVPQTVIAAARPSPSTAAATSPSPSGAATPATSASASPSPTPSASPSTVAASPTPKPIDLAKPVTKEFVHLDLVGGRAPLAVSQSGERLWVLDDKNVIQSIELGSGEVAVLTGLPRTAQISQFIAGRAYLYALDEQNGELYVVAVSGDATASVGLRLPKTVSSAAVGLGDQLWLGLSDSSLLLRFEPKTKLTFLFDLRGAHVSKLATDPLGRVFYADDVRNAVGLLDPATGNTTEAAFPRHGVTTALVVDASSTLWLGTSAGEIWNVRGGVYTLTAALQRPVTTISLDVGGRAWYLSPLPAGSVGFAYASADGAREGRSISGPAFSLSFSALGRAWLADPRGGFWVSGGTP